MSPFQYYMMSLVTLSYLSTRSASRQHVILFWQYDVLWQVASLWLDTFPSLYRCVSHCDHILWSNNSFHGLGFMLRYAMYLDSHIIWLVYMVLIMIGHFSQTLVSFYKHCLSIYVRNFICLSIYVSNFICI